MIPENMIFKALPKNAGTHNSIYRGQNITDLFYDGTLSKQISAETFDDIFIGDYIIGKVSKRKYLVADINYRLHCGNTECTTPHILIIPERVMGMQQMNATNITTEAYIGTEMYKTHLETYKTIIRNDFGVGHIIKHQELFANAVKNGYASEGAWFESDIDLMNECMAYGSYIFSPKTHHSGGTDTTIPYLYTIDKSQLSLFRLKPDFIIALNDTGQRTSWWLRDVVSSTSFANVGSTGNANKGNASYSVGVRPAFLIK